MVREMVREVFTPTSREAVPHASQPVLGSLLSYLEQFGPGVVQVLHGQEAHHCEAEEADEGDQGLAQGLADEGHQQAGQDQKHADRLDAQVAPMRRRQICQPKAQDAPDNLILIDAVAASPAPLQHRCAQGEE